jgi:hypothetical protein
MNTMHDTEKAEEMTVEKIDAKPTKGSPLLDIWDHPKVRVHHDILATAANLSPAMATYLKAHGSLQRLLDGIQWSVLRCWSGHELEFSGQRLPCRLWKRRTARIVCRAYA